MIFSGVRAGAKSPTQPSTWKPGTPDSAIVGRSGNGAKRVAVVTASAFSLPVLTWGSDDGGVANDSCASLPIRPIMTGPPPLYDTPTISVLVASLNNSALKCGLVPMPG